MKRLLGIALTLAFGACGSGSDVDVAGEYTIALTNRDNGCELENYTEGEQASNIPVSITQEGSNVTATVGGGGGLVLDLALGSRVFTGEVDGDDVFLELFGTRGQQQGNCSFTFNSAIDATLDGDVLTGTIDYRAATNDNPDCAALEGCRTFQEFNGTRPPQ
jgi:hypothetical protein